MCVCGGASKCVCVGWGCVLVNVCVGWGVLVNVCVCGVVCVLINVCVWGGGVLVSMCVCVCGGGTSKYVYRGGWSRFLINLLIFFVTSNSVKTCRESSYPS